VETNNYSVMYYFEHLRHGSALTWVRWGGKWVHLI